MANVYFRSSVQFVFAVKNRAALIHDDFQQELHSYIGGILLNGKHKPLAINSMPDHIHIFFGMYPCDIPDLVRDIKSESSKWINKNHLSRFRFQWQEGYGFFTYSVEHRSNLIHYVNNQQIHHKNESFQNEYIRTLDEFELEYEIKYLFDFFS